MSETPVSFNLATLERATFLTANQVNAQTVDSISAYLTSPMSDCLRDLSLNQCGLTGEDVAVFMMAMTRAPGQPRELHL